MCRINSIDSFTPNEKEIITHFIEHMKKNPSVEKVFLFDITLNNKMKNTAVHSFLVVMDSDENFTLESSVFLGGEISAQRRRYSYKSILPSQKV